MNTIHTLSSIISKTHFNPTAVTITTNLRLFTTKNGGGGKEEWNDAWESAWLPEDLSAKNRAPWETDVTFSLSDSTTNNPSISLAPEADAETKAFVEDMNDNWDNRRRHSRQQQEDQNEILVKKDGGDGKKSGLYSLENVKRDYRLKKQRVHAGLWMKEIEKQAEAHLVDSVPGGGHDDIDKLLDSCSEIFYSGNSDLNNSNIVSSSELKSKPDGWETTSKIQDGNVWEMSQREEDILLQEFERRIAFSKFQIASFIKTHIFSRRRPIDGWKYMIEELGPNAKKGKGSVSRVPTLSDASTQPFREEKTPITSNLTSYKRR